MGSARIVIMNTNGGMMSAMMREDRPSSCRTNKYSSHMTQEIEQAATAEYQASSTGSSRRGSTYCKLKTHQAMQESAKKRCVRSARRDHQNSRKNTPIASSVTLHATGMMYPRNSLI